MISKENKKIKYIYISLDVLDKLEYKYFELTDFKSSNYKRIDVILDTPKMLFLFDANQRKEIRDLYKKWREENII